MPRQRESVRESAEALLKLIKVYSGVSQKKLQMLLQLSKGARMEDIAHALDTSVRTLSRWWKVYTSEGIDALLHDKKLVGDPYIAIIPFLNSLPTSSQPEEWLAQLKLSLETLLPDVDRVSINVNFNYDVNRADSATTRLLEQLNRESVVIGISNDLEESYVNAITRLGFPAHLYASHIELPIIDHRSHPIGTLVFWREHGKSPISKTTVSLIQSLRPFFGFIMTDAVARSNKEKLDGIHQYNDIIREIIETTDLKDREVDVLRLLILGQDAEEIARSLNITTHAVRKHITAIHRKTGTQTIRKLFQKYLLPIMKRRVRNT